MAIPHMPAEHCTGVGIVMPLHNKRAFVGRAIESVLNQTCDNWQLMVVDDGSTDGSAAIVERFSDSRISLVRTPCSGPGAARNIGLRATNAEWVALLDADDEWD
ncbi:MAG: glycosyl transferase family 2, partial [Gemmatimonadetes bacterium]|nr:glycosyl transferase family 2 [Gemmatimonadota bacterium]